MPIDDMDEWQRERWRGEVDVELKTIKETLRDQSKEISNMAKEHQALALAVKGLSTKLTGYAAIGAFLGGGAMSVVVGLFFRH